MFTTNKSAYRLFNCPFIDLRPPRSLIVFHNKFYQNNITNTLKPSLYIRYH